MERGLEALKSSYDVIVVGARCAGASTAMLLARSGVDVLVVERGVRGADTLSTLALMRRGVLQLSRWGLLEAVKAAGTPRIGTTTFHYGDDAVEIRIKPREGVDGLYAPRRTLLDPMIADAAQSSGAEIAYRVRLKGLRRGPNGRISGAVLESGGRTRSIAATLVIGADGLDSIVAKEVGAAPYRLGAHMSAVIYTRVSGLDPDGYHWYYRPGTSAGVIPTNAGESLVFVSIPRQRFVRELRFDLASAFATVVGETSPELAAAMRTAPAGAFHGFAGRPGAMRPAWGPGWALVGDAGYFKDPLTAHGITDALRDAELLAQAVVGGTEAALAGYQAVRDDLSLPLFSITDEIASFGWDMPRLQRLHKSLSDEMTREALFPIGGPETPSYARQGA